MKWMKLPLYTSISLYKELELELESHACYYSLVKGGVWWMCSPPQSCYPQGWRLPEFPAVHISSWIFQQQHPAQLQRLAWEKPAAEHWRAEWEVAGAAASCAAAAAGLFLSIKSGFTSARGKIYICKHSALLSPSIVSTRGVLHKSWKKHLKIIGRQSSGFQQLISRSIW